MWPFKKKVEKRSGGFLAEVLAARTADIFGARGVAEATATAQSCVSLWEHGGNLATVSGTTMLDSRTMSMLFRSLALRGESLWLIRDRLVPAYEWTVATQDGEPRVYRLQIADTGGGHAVDALAGEVLHIRIGSDPSAPWAGQAPLRRANLTASMLHSVESALAEVFDMAPLGTQVVPMPEQPNVDLATMAREFRGQRGRVLLRESVNVGAAGGPTPNVDWHGSDLTPNLANSLADDVLECARNAICAAFGVLPALFDKATTGPLVREAQRHLAQWTLAPICELIAEEATRKLGSTVSIDAITRLGAVDHGGRSRAFSAIIAALAQAKEAGLSDADVNDAWARSLGDP